MLTVTKLARRCGVSRTALLYYESIGLMPPPQRSGGNYRCYSEADAQRLLHIRAYRNAGLTLEDIRTILKTQTGKKRSGRRGGDASETRQHATKTKAGSGVPAGRLILTPMG